MNTTNVLGEEYDAFLDRFSDMRSGFGSDLGFPPELEMRPVEIVIVLQVEIVDCPPRSIQISLRMEPNGLHLLSMLKQCVCRHLPSETVVLDTPWSIENRRLLFRSKESRKEKHGRLRRCEDLQFGGVECDARGLLYDAFQVTRHEKL